LPLPVPVTIPLLLVSGRPVLDLSVCITLPLLLLFLLLTGRLFTGNRGGEGLAEVLGQERLHLVKVVLNHLVINCWAHRLADT
jgi:hypothetical protein